MTLYKYGEREMTYTLSYSNFIYYCVDQLRSYWKYFQANNPILSFIKSYDDSSIEQDLYESNGRKASSEDSCKAYHHSINFSEQNKQGIFQYHSGKSQGEKTLVILCMGNQQCHGDSEKNVGMLKLYNRLKDRDNVDILLCRVGCSQAALSHRLGLSSDSSLHPDIVLNHISNLVDDRNHCRGIFVKEQKPSKVIMAGFSWGGGAVKEITDRWERIGAGLKIPLAVTLDAIQHGLDNLGDELTVRPQHAEKVLNIYQDNDSYLNGADLTTKDSGDSSFNAKVITEQAVSHKTIDDDPWVMQKIFWAIDQEIRIKH